jgi:serine/threonine protein kinase
MQVGDTLQDSYLLEAFIGQGGQGECWLVREGAQQWLCKCHRLHQKGWSPVELVEREARILRQLDHPAIPAFRDLFIDTDTTTLCLLREWIPGQSLEQTIESKRWSEDDVRDIATQLLDVLHYIHSLSPAVIHRDLKPSNIILKPDNTVSLIDFGSVRDTIAAQDGASIIGTYGYTPPEQFLGHPTVASDLYALGATLVFLLARQHPATLPLAHNQLQLASYINVKPRFLRILQRLLAPTTEARFSSAQEVLDALKRTSSFANPLREPDIETTVTRAATMLPAATTTRPTVVWQRNRAQQRSWWWERQYDLVDTPIVPASSFEPPDLSQVIHILRERHHLEELDELSDPLDIVTAIDQHFGKDDETGRKLLLRLLHPHDAADLLLGYYEPSFLLPLYADAWIERFSLLYTHTPDNPIGRWTLLYFLEKHGWLPQADWHQDNTLSFEQPNYELMGLPRRMSRALRTLSAYPIGKRAKHFDQIMKHWHQISEQYHLCTRIRPGHLTTLVEKGYQELDHQLHASYPEAFRECWDGDRLLRWTLRTLTAWPPPWLKIGAIFNQDANKYQRLGTYMTTVYYLYGAFDELRTQLQEEYNWLLPNTTTALLPK